MLALNTHIHDHTNRGAAFQRQLLCVVAVLLAGNMECTRNNAQLQRKFKAAQKRWAWSEMHVCVEGKAGVDLACRGVLCCAVC